ncbi:MAG: transport permease protein [Chitinophagales bacterium]|nr:MAG: transport permease protein [Chitinophagales bacterium]
MPTRLEVKPTRPWRLLTLSDIRELLEYRDLMYMLMVREIKVLYKQTIIGMGWVILKPLLQMLMFTVIFGKLAGIEKMVGGNVPYAVFAYIALVPWSYFSAALTNATSSLVSNSEFITKIYFPRVIIPMVPVFAKLVDFVFAFLLLIPLMLYYGIPPTLHILFLPLLVLLLVASALAGGLWLSALAIQYRDVSQAVQFLVQLLMFASPIIWPLSFIPEKYIDYYSFYPMAGIIEGFRAAMLGSPMPWEMLGRGSLTTLIVLLTGIVFYRNREKVFADVV